MPRVKSAKGKVIDFDLLKIKRQMSGKPISIDVKARQNYIDQKARRRLRKVTNKAIAATIDVQSEVLANIETTKEQPLIEAKQAPLPQVVDVSKQVVHATNETETTEERHTKQKVRPPKE